MTTIDYLQAVRSDGLHTGMVHRHQLEVFLGPALEGEPVDGRGETLHLHATDTEGEWLPRVRGLAARATQ